MHLSSDYKDSYQSRSTYPTNRSFTTSLARPPHIASRRDPDRNPRKRSTTGEPLRAEIPGGTHHELDPRRRRRRRLCARSISSCLAPPEFLLLAVRTKQISPGRPSVRLSLVDHPSPSDLSFSYPSPCLPTPLHTSIDRSLSTRLSHNDEIYQHTESSSYCPGRPPRPPANVREEEVGDEQRLSRVGLT